MRDGRGPARRHWLPSRNYGETLAQKAIVEGLRRVLGKLYLVIHVPNEGERSESMNGILVGMGMVPGAADLVIAGAGFCGFLEVKGAKGRLSHEQETFRQDCAARGIPYAVVRDVDEAVDAAVSWGIASRAPDGAVRALPSRGTGAMAGRGDPVPGRVEPEALPGLRRVPGAARPLDAHGPEPGGRGKLTPG